MIAAIGISALYFAFMVMTTTFGWYTFDLLAPERRLWKPDLDLIVSLVCGFLFPIGIWVVLAIALNVTHVKGWYKKEIRYCQQCHLKTAHWEKGEWTLNEDDNPIFTDIYRCERCRTQMKIEVC